MIFIEINDDKIINAFTKNFLSFITSMHISATGDPIHFMFCSRVGFSGTADLMA